MDLILNSFQKQLVNSIFKSEKIENNFYQKMEIEGEDFENQLFFD